MEEPIRILHILHSMNRGGAENALMNYYRNIDRSKVQFDFLLTEKNKCQFEDEIITLGGCIFRISPLKMSNPFPYIRDIRNFFKDHPVYKIVHSHTSSKSVFPLYAAKKAGIKIRCSHSHNSQTERGFTGIIRNVLKPVLKLVATDWLACGEQAARWLYGAKAFDAGNVTIYKNVIETDKFQFNAINRECYRKKYNISSDTLVIGHTARFSPQKNHLFDIDILHCLKKKGVKAKLLLLGDGELKHSIVLKAKELGVYDDIMFVGIVPNVYDYEQAFDVFILPSFYEGLPLSIIEAQVSGLPCITTINAVSYECSVTDLVKYLPIDQGANIWADTIVELNKIERRNRWGEIVASGYDAKTTSRILQDFYIKRYLEA